jgi:hypothetical protein
MNQAWEGKILIFGSKLTRIILGIGLFYQKNRQNQIVAGNHLAAQKHKAYLLLTII